MDNLGKSLDNLHAENYSLEEPNPENAAAMEAGPDTLEGAASPDDQTRARNKSLGFRKWQDQKSALDKFHGDEEARKAAEAKKKADDLAAKEADIYKRTETSMAMFEAQEKARKEAERKAKEEALVKKEAEMHQKHHNLRKEREEAERKAAEEAEAKRKKAEAKRKRQLDKQAKKMKKFEEDRRWKTLPNWKKEKEEEILAKVKQLKELDPSRDKYEFFDVQRVPDAWDEDLLDKELAKAANAKGEKEMARLNALDPSADMSVYKKEDKWDFKGLKWAIEQAEKAVEEEEKAGDEAFVALRIYSAGSKRETYHKPTERPRWNMEDLEFHTHNAKKQVNGLLESLRQYLPDLAESDYQDEESRFDVSELRRELEARKNAWQAEFTEGEGHFAVLKDVDPNANREEFFLGEDAARPWAQDKLAAARGGRIVVTVELRQFESHDAPEPTTSQLTVVVMEDGAGSSAVAQIVDQAPGLTTGVDEAKIELAAQGGDPLDTSAALSSQGVQHKSQLVATVERPRQPTPEPEPEPEPAPQKKGKKAKKQAKQVTSAAPSAGGAAEDEAEADAPAPSSGGCCIIQ